MLACDGICKKIGLVAASFILALLMVQTSLAAAVDRDLALKVAGNYLEYLVQTFDRWPEADPFIESLTPVFYKETKVFWHVDVSPSGFLLISSSDELSPIKLYSETGQFDPDRATKQGSPVSWIIPEQFLSVVAVSFATKIRAPLQGDEGVSRQIRQAWDLFGQPRAWKTLSKTSAHPPRTVGPLVTARWGQDPPLQPAYPEGRRGEYEGGMRGYSLVHASPALAMAEARTGREDPCLGRPGTDRGLRSADLELERHAGGAHGRILPRSHRSRGPARLSGGHGR